MCHIENFWKEKYESLEKQLILFERLQTRMCSVKKEEYIFLYIRNILYTYIYISFN